MCWVPLIQEFRWRQIFRCVKKCTMAYLQRYWKHWSHLGDLVKIVHECCWQIHSNAFWNTFLELSRLSSISQYREYEECQECFHCGGALRNFIRNTMHLKRVSKQLCVYLLYRSVFLAQTCFQIALFSAFEKGVSITHNQNSFAFIICKRCF